MSKRAIRRHHRERLKKTRRNYWSMDFDREFNPEFLDQEIETKKLGKVVNTPHPCSCYACGNPRKHFGEIPMRELRKPNINDF